MTSRIGPSFRIREEAPGDFEAIREVNRRAFKGEDEGVLIDRLRRDGLFITSLVAVQGTEVVGHILFSHLPVETAAGSLACAALAPMAVIPEEQHQGIGSVLVVRGLELCRERGIQAVIVLGHPAYYPRFGFSPETAQVLEAPFSGEAFMALELRAGALTHGGKIVYPQAFFEIG